MDDLEKLDQAFQKMLQDFPEERENLVVQGGARLYEQVVENIETRTKEKTGNLRRACYLDYGSGKGYAAVRNDPKKAPHGHLVEYGHRVVKGGKYILSKKAQARGDKPGYVPTDENGKEKFVTGKFMYANAAEQTEDELMGMAEEMMDRLLEEW